MLLCSIAPPLYYETAILVRRDWMLPRAVNPYGSAFQKQKNQDWTQIRTIPKMRVSSVGWVRYKRIHRAPIRATQSTCPSHNWIQTYFSPIDSQHLLQPLMHSYNAPHRYHSFRDSQCKYWKASPERRCRKLIFTQQICRIRKFWRQCNAQHGLRSFYNTRRYQQQINNTCRHSRRQTRSPQDFNCKRCSSGSLVYQTIQQILESNLTEAVIDTVSGLVLALRQAERANMARIRLFSGINAHLFDGNNNSVMSHANLATTQRQIGIQQLTSGQSVAKVQGNLIGANAFLNLQPPQRHAMLTPAQITNNLLLGINTKQEQQTQQSQISQAPSQGPFQAQFQQNLQSQQQPLSLNRGLFNIVSQPQLSQQNSGLPDLSINRQQQIAPILPVIQNPQQQGAGSEGSQTQRRNSIARNSHTVMEIDMESEGRDINPPPLEAKINQTSFNRQRDYWATKSYLLKFIGKPGAGRHYPGYGEGQIEVQEVILRHARGETISIADWRKFWKELDTDLKLDTVRLQSPVSESEDQGREKDQSTAFRNNPRKRYRQDGSVAPWPPVESTPATTSNTVVPDLTQRQIGGPTPQLVRTPDSWKSNKTPTPKQQSKQLTPIQGTTGQPQPTIQQQLITIHPQPQVYQFNTQPSLSTSQSSETTSSNIISIPTPSVHQVQQEQGHLLLPPVAVSPPPINPANLELPPVVDALPDNTTQQINNSVIPQQQVQNQQQLASQQQQLFNLQSQQFTNQTYRLPDAPDSWSSITTQPQSLELRTQQEAQRLHNERILQENRARNEYRIHMHQRAQNKAQKYLMDGMMVNLEA
ncbi:MAG: hypothetical protein EZS28_028018, partial [Streblomastix strix]